MEIAMNLRPYIEKFSRRFSEVEAALSDPKVVGQHRPNCRNFRANTPGSRN